MASLRMIATMTLLRVSVILCSIKPQGEIKECHLSCLCEFNSNVRMNLIKHSLNSLCMFITAYLSEEELCSDSEEYEAPFTINQNINRDLKSLYFFTVNFYKIISIIPIYTNLSACR